MMVVGLAIGALITILLFVPVYVVLEWDGRPASIAPRVRVRIRWLVFVWGSGAPRPSHPATVKEARSRPPHTGAPRRRFLAVLTTPGFLPRVGRLVLELLRVLAPRAVDGSVRFGFDDPVSTGVLYGGACAASGWARAAGWRLQFEPEFTGPSFSGHGRIEWLLRPGRLVWPVGTFAASPATWRAVRAAVRAR